MNSKKSLLLGQGIFTIILIISLGFIVINEKGNNLLKNKADQTMNDYLKENYNEILTHTNIEKTKGNNKKYTKKITSKQNPNLYFYIKYNHKKITDTYEKDYNKGESLLKYISKNLEADIKRQTNITCTIKPTTTLNQYSTIVKEQILKEEHLKELKFYYIQKELMINNWNTKEITQEINNIIQTMNDNKITPKYYEITIINKNEITTAIKISNITDDFIDNNNAEKIIDNILNNKEIDDSKITYQYQN